MNGIRSRHLQFPCSARVVRAEGTQVSLQLEARDEYEVIARGFHRLHVIQVEQFAQRLRAKKPQG